MGQVSEDILDGLMCQECGVWMPDLFDGDLAMNEELWKNPPGYPRSCPDCKEDE